MGERIRIDVADGTFGAYLARPDATAPAPAVVVAQEIFGINADMRATCDELAAQGFLALCPDLFWRQEPGVELSAFDDAEWQRGLALYQAFDFDRGVDDLAGALAAARALPGASGRVGLMGFCMGGLLTYLTAARRGVDAGVAYYGGGTERHLGEAAGLDSPLLVHLAEEDEFIDPPAQAAIRDVLGPKPGVRIHSYAGCNHAFARHSGAHHDAAAARLAQSRTLAFLHGHLD
ncbi:dienelactone hydrolase family protein [Rubrivivax sp. RP6-9]|uniref:dienelactone hydrolase family protein n=1 Tax=Rubrivivax sp. RP6-9 TaxID=3415750 RepID=UPI003CC5A212